MITIVRTSAEIEELFNRAADAAAEGSRWPGMSYEQGCDETIRWLIGDEDYHPLLDEEED